MGDVVAWTDGSCLGNPGPGGWGAILVFDGQESEISGGEAQSTNNRMEIMAAMKAIESSPPGRKLTVRSDSQYVRDGITKWIRNWKRNGWLTSDRRPVKNAELWRGLDAAVAAHGHVAWEWVRGHAGNVMNERVDAIARREAATFR
jgi:ribonuclease HI